jgi:hypothetical protein
MTIRYITPSCVSNMCLFVPMHYSLFTWSSFNLLASVGGNLIALLLTQLRSATVSRHRSCSRSQHSHMHLSAKPPLAGLL